VSGQLRFLGQALSQVVRRALGLRVACLIGCLRAAWRLPIVARMLYQAGISAG